MSISLAPEAVRAPACQCRTLPAAAPEAGTLYTCSPAAEPGVALRNYFAAAGFDLTEPQPGVLAVKFDAGGLAALADGLPSVLTDTQLAATRAVVAGPGVIPSVADLMSTQTLSAVLAGVRHRWLVEVLRDDRLTTHFQPIVAAADPGAVYGYECLVRGLDPAGKLIPPGSLFDAARAADLLFPLDRAARLTAIREAVRHGVDAGAKLFVNFNPTAIYNPEFCLRTTFRAIEEAGMTPDQVVFEVVESEDVRDPAHLLGILKTYREAGFRVALDDVGAGYNSLTLLTKLRPDYVKLDMGLVRDVDRDEYKAAVVRKLLEMANDLGARTVVEGVETVGEWRWAADHGADFAQGYLFARPASPPPRPAGPAGSD